MPHSSEVAARLPHDGPTFTMYCPCCGHDDIAGADVVPATAGIAGWRRHPTTGEREPVWEGSVALDWTRERPDRPEAPYRCRKCNAWLAADELDTQRRAGHETPLRARAAAPIARIVVVMMGGRPCIIADQPVAVRVIGMDATLEHLAAHPASELAHVSPNARVLAVDHAPELVAAVFARQV